MAKQALLALAAALILGSVIPAHAQGRGQQVQLPEGTGKDTVQKVCTT